jgi:HD-like signal output (HDOD) protein
MSNGPFTAPPAVSALLQSSGVLGATQIIPHLHAELAKDESTFAPILSAIALDRPLSQRVIDISNSAWFGGRMKSDTVEVAFGRLGVADFYKVVVSATLRYHLGNSDQPDFKRWWTQSETTARLAELLAPHLDATLVEPSFFIGLLHDCAVPLMAKHVPDFSYLVDGALGFQPEGIEMEQECNQFTHCDVGAALITAWQFPDAYAEAVRFHHRQTLELLSDDRARRLLAILLLAKRIDYWCKNELPAEFTAGAEHGLGSEIANAFRLTRGQLSDVLTEMTRLYRLRQSHA